MCDSVSEKEFESRLAQMLINFLEKSHPSDVHELGSPWNFDNFTTAMEWIDKHYAAFCAVQTSRGKTRK